MNTDFEKMCKELSKKSCGGENEYRLAKNKVEEYIKETEKDRLLNLKSQMMSTSFTETLSLFFSGMAFFLSILGVFAASSLQTKWSIMVIMLVAVIAVIIVIIKYHHVYRWREYIRNAIEQIEKEYK